LLACLRSVLRAIVHHDDLSALKRRVATAPQRSFRYAFCSTLSKAISLEKGQNLPLTYEVADLNFVQLPEETFDLVVAQTALITSSFSSMSWNKFGVR
jgi:hypothetical protein